MAAIDPTKAGKYPVILSPELLGKPSKETYTGVRYNHKPTLSSDVAPNSSRLKKSAQEGTFILGDGRNTYRGVRTTGDSNYVLIFDPKRQAFVLHRVDSMFHMNLVRTPTDNMESLRKKFPHLEIKHDAVISASSSKSPSQAETQKNKSAAGNKPSVNNTSNNNKKPIPTRANPKAPVPRQAAPLKAPLRNPKGKGKAAVPAPAPEKKKAPISITLPDPKAKPRVSLPMPTLPTKKAAPPEPEKKPKKRTDSDEEDSDEDDDFGLTIEYPDANIRHVAVPPPASLDRRFSTDDFGAGGGGRGNGDELDFSAFERERSRRDAMDVDDDDDEDEGETFENVMLDDVKLMPPPPRPLPRAPAAQVMKPPPVMPEPEVYTFDAGTDDEEEEQEATQDDDFDELEAALEAAFDTVEGGGGGDAAADPGGESDSEVSEEE